MLAEIQSHNPSLLRHVPGSDTATHPAMRLTDPARRNLSRIGPMNFTTPEVNPAVKSPVAPSETPPKPARKPFALWKATKHLLRRGHLYAGLMMLPWVILYGITAFLFNHPTAFSDQPSSSFGKSALAGTPMESPPAPLELAGQVVAGLQARDKGGKTYTLVEPEKAKFTRDAAFATVKADGAELNVLVYVNSDGGTVRSRPSTTPKPTEERAPFAIGNAGGVGGRAPTGGARAPGGRPGGARTADSLKLDNPLHERVAAAIPAVLDSTGFPKGEVTVTSVPDLTFVMSDGEKNWNVTYNAQNGTVAGKPTDAEPAPSELSPRRFLTRLHLAHGYPGEMNAKWVWAVIVDAMAFIMVFWGLSGLIMWWQIKATRWIGLIVVILSGLAATLVGMGMHELLSATGRG